MRTHFVLPWVALVLFALVMVAPVLADPDPKSDSGEEIITKYQDAVHRQEQALKNVAMDVTMEASIPKLKKAGRLSALRRISSLGRITYKLLGFDGDDVVKKEIIGRYLTAEVEAAQNHRDDIAINEKNYKFKYKGLNERDGRPVHIFELKPRFKRVGLFEGELWIDPNTALPLREAGRFKKSPSMFIKKIEFVRNYEIRDGVAYPTHIESKTDTRLVGRADLNIDFSNIHPQAEATADELVEEARDR